MRILIQTTAEREGIRRSFLEEKNTEATQRFPRKSKKHGRNYLLLGPPIEQFDRIYHLSSWVDTVNTATVDCFFRFYGNSFQLVVCQSDFQRKPRSTPLTFNLVLHVHPISSNSKLTSRDVLLPPEAFADYYINWNRPHS